VHPFDRVASFVHAARIVRRGIGVRPSREFAAAFAKRRVRRDVHGR